MSWLSLTILGLPVWLWLVILIILALGYWFWLKPLMNESSSNSADDIVRSDVVRLTNGVLAIYRPTVGETNDPAGTEGVSVELKETGQIHIRLKNPGMSARHLRHHTIAIIQGRETVGTTSPIVYMADTVATADLPPLVQANKGVRISFSSLLKPALVTKSA